MSGFSELLYTALLDEQGVCRLTSSGDEIMIRCVYCGDSTKSSYSAHFYIQTAFPHYCYCQRCNVKSAVSISMLNDFGIQNRQLRIETMKLERNRKFKIGEAQRQGNNSFADSIMNVENDYKIPEYVGTQGELKRLKYLNDRLDLNLTLDDATNLKVILNFKEFMKQNRIQPREFLTVEKFLSLHEDHIGFLSQDNNFIVFRSLDPELTCGYRYYNYNISGKRENTRKYYTISSEIDLLDPDINIVITEGIIDLISVYYNVYGGTPKKFLKGNTVFVSTNGIGLGLVVNTVAKLGFLTPNVIIYSDNGDGLDANFYRKLKERNIFLEQSKVTVYFNKLEKDFGVPKDSIESTFIYV